MAIDLLALDLGYETAGHILSSVAGRGMGFAAVDLRGAVLWSSDRELDLEAMRSVSDKVAAGIAVDGEDIALGDRGRLSARPICNVPDSPLAWMVAWSADEGGLGGSSSEWKRVCETLPRVADMLSRECRLANELSGAVSELENRYEELNIVYQMEREARDAPPDDGVVQKMLDVFLDHLGVDVGLLVAADVQKSLSARGTDRPILNVDLVLTELQGKVWRFISASKKPLVMNDRNDERRGYLLTNLPFKLMAIPNETCGEPTGGLLLLRHQDEPDFTNSDLSLARVFFGQAMILMRNHVLLANMERFTRQIASSLVETVEAKDPYTRGHSERVERITAGIGHQSGIEPEEFNDLLWGALLHDIGKIGIPDAILMKPSRLTADEYTFIKTHPNRSYEILKHVEQLGPAALDGARYHQERFDGTGYPFGLAGTEIPLAARIIAVADTYDAVTSSRSYRPASSHEEGVRIVREVAGDQLDPDLVRYFLDLIESDEEWLGGIRATHVETGRAGG